MLLIVLFLLGTHAHAQFSSTPVSTTVESTKSIWEGSAVVLEGYLIEQLEDTIYLFQDSTGRIKVNIEYSDFEFLSFDDETKVKLQGKVDVLWPSKFRQINVDYVEIITEKADDITMDAEKKKDCI